MNNYHKTLIYIAFLLGLNTLQAKTVYFVTSIGTGDGSSWTNSASNIQTMIDKAVSGDEVWVAKGTYYPTTETIARDPSSRTFILKNGVNVYGGFVGTETSITQRVLSDLDGNGKIDEFEFVNTTLLSGDIDGVNDVWTKTLNSDAKTWNWTVSGNEGNCKGVVLGSSFNIETYFDGFSVIGGSTSGIFSQSNLFITNCTVSNCSEKGIYSTASSSSTSNYNVSNCNVKNCSGIGIYSSTYSMPYPQSNITKCTVSNCSAGGIYSCSFATSSTSSSSVTNCIVNNCSGRGIYSYSSTASSKSSNSTSTVTNCNVSNCSTLVGDGGGIYSDSKAST